MLVAINVNTFFYPPPPPPHPNLNTRCFEICVCLRKVWAGLKKKIGKLFWGCTSFDHDGETAKDFFYVKGKKAQYVPCMDRRQPHRQIEKRRRDKMNNLIDELATMIPACQPMPRKLDKLTVLRKAVQHLKALKGKVTLCSTFANAACKPSIVPHDDLRHLLLRVADGFLLVVSCDRAKILFISESVSKILSFSRVELTGQSLFDFIHPKDISKVKEQLSSSELNPHQRLIDAATGAPVHADAPVTASHLSTGARRSFFCRMKHNRGEGKYKDKRTLPTASKKDSSRYCTLHCSGYMRSWPRSDLDSETDGEKVTTGLTCLVTMCRVQAHASHQPPKDVKVKPTKFVTRCAIDGKFTFVEQQATTVIGYLPQEILGTSCYEYFHQDDLQHLSEKHRQVLRSKEKLETKCYKFKTKHGPYVSLQSQWFSFTNPWTKEVEFVVSLNRVIQCAFYHSSYLFFFFLIVTSSPTEESKQLPIIPGLTSNVGKMIYAGSIGTQIANELIDSYRRKKKRQHASGGHIVQTGNLKSGCVFLRVPGDPSQQDLDSMLVPGLSSFSSDEAAMAVIMSLIETDVNMGQSGDLDDLHWPF
uniref:Basic helix-loop-helix ARNT like 2 n=1 Tax=Hippocampus comes TaxID=109280 RepID=A0A3Q2XVJ3_HIPCM